jgi:hypothetical protein
VLIDWAAMLSGYSSPAYDDNDKKPRRCYLEDGHHPRDPYMLSMAFLLDQVGLLWSKLARCA